MAATVLQIAPIHSGEMPFRDNLPLFDPNKRVRISIDFSQGKSKNTLGTYKSSMSKFFNWLDTNYHACIRENAKYTQQQVIDSYLMYLMNGFSLKTFSLHKSVLRAYVMWAYQRDLCPAPGIFTMRYVASTDSMSADQERVLTKSLSIPNKHEVIESLRVFEEAGNVRDYLALYLMCYLGMRTVEIVRLQRKHIVCRDGDFYVGSHGKAETMSGSLTWRKITPGVAEKLLSFFRSRAEFYNPEAYFYTRMRRTSKAVVPYSDQPMTTRALRMSMGPILDMIFPSRNVRPHDYRRSVVTIASNAGVEDHKIARTFNMSLKTIRKYDRSTHNNETLPWQHQLEQTLHSPKNTEAIPE